MIQTGCVTYCLCDSRIPRPNRIAPPLAALLTILATYHAEATGIAGIRQNSLDSFVGHAADAAPASSVDSRAARKSSDKEGYSYSGWRLLEIPFALLALSVLSIPALSRLRARAKNRLWRATVSEFACDKQDGESLTVGRSRPDGGAPSVFIEDSLTADFLSLPDGTLVSCNPAFAKLFGYDSVDAALQGNAASFFHDAGGWHRLTDGISQQKCLRKIELSMRDQRERPLHVLANLSGDFGTGQTLLRVRGHLFDMTELHNMEERLRHAQKLELVGQLAGGIAHDFNNVLSAILGFTDLSMSTLPPGSPVLEHLINVRKAGEQAEVLTRQLLAFSRHREPQPKILNLNKVLAEMDKMLRRLIGENIALVMRVAPELDHIKADPGQVTQVILNLVVNARDAMPEGGRLVIETMNVRPDGRDVHPLPGAPIGPHVMIAVSDAGCGMDQATQARIFEPFFTTKADGKGSGLGLATVYGIVQQAGGNISVTSEPGQGSTFRVAFPACLETPGAALPVKRAAPDVRGSETVLIVEDDALVRELTRRSLEQAGYTVLAARNGEEALAASSRHRRNIDLLVTDVVMPGMSGVELAAKFRPLRPATRIMYMSGYTSSLVLVKGPEPGAEAHFLQKPFGPHELREAVRKILDGSGMDRISSFSCDSPPPS